MELPAALLQGSGMAAQRVKERTCNYAIGDVVCSRQAVVKVERQKYGTLLLCVVHINDQRIYADVQANSWKWAAITP